MTERHRNDSEIKCSPQTKEYCAGGDAIQSIAVSFICVRPRQDAKWHQSKGVIVLEEHSVLMLSYAFPPIASSGSFRIARFARYLPEFGWRPIVVSPRPEHAIYNQVDPSLARLIPSDIILEGTSVPRPLISARKWARVLFPGRPDKGPVGVQTPNTAKPQRIRPVRDLFGTLVGTPDRHVGWILPAVRASLSLIRRHRPRAIFSSGPPHSAHVVAIILKRLTGLPVVCDFRDPWARNPWQALNSRFQPRAQSLLEHMCVRRADAVVLNTENALQEFDSYYANQQHGEFTVIPNGYDPVLAETEQIPNLTNNSIPANRAIRLCHSGTIYGHRNLLPLILAIAKLKASGSSFELEQMGKVDSVGKVTESISRNQLTNEIHLRGHFFHDQLLAQMRKADILVVIQGKADLQVPAKLFEMLPFRKPILALTGSGPTADIVQKYKLGRVVDPENHDAIAGVLPLLASGWPEADDQSHARQALHDFDGRRQTGMFAEVLTNCVTPENQTSV